MRALRQCAVLQLLLTLATGCQSIGPSTVPRDRFDYSEAVGQSWKQQMLLNVVKLRYADVPIFVDVGQIVAGYSLETAANFQGVVSSEGAVQGDNFALGGQGRFTDRPTITYMPLTGSKFLGNLLTPIAPAALFSAVQSGWPVDFLLTLGTDSINGLQNERSTAGGYVEADPRFYRAAELLRQAQLSDGVSIRVRGGGNDQKTLLVLRDPGMSSDSASALAELRGLLGLRAGASEYDLAIGSRAASDTEIAIQSRSLFKILQVLGDHVEAPSQHVADGRVSAGAPHIGSEESLFGFRIRSTAEEPDDAFVTARYRDVFFYIDDRDLRSKRLFSLIMLLYALAETGIQQAPPTLTIPTQ